MFLRCSLPVSGWCGKSAPTYVVRTSLAPSQSHRVALGATTRHRTTGGDYLRIQAMGTSETQATNALKAKIAEQAGTAILESRVYLWMGIVSALDAPFQVGA